MTKPRISESLRSSSSATTPARGRPTTRSSSARAVPESYRYRMPEAYRPSGTFQQRQAWANKARAIERVGRTGIQSCSPVGPAGYTGCMEQMINSRARKATRPIAKARLRSSKASSAAPQ